MGDEIDVLIQIRIEIDKLPLERKQRISEVAAAMRALAAIEPLALALVGAEAAAS